MSRWHAIFTYHIHDYLTKPSLGTTETVTSLVMQLRPNVIASQSNYHGQQNMQKHTKKTPQLTYFT
ncbi:hypothetical protein BDE02_08G095600 [Populus trichocarpa]|nr:hypothetical protein BDE02_08G095600 [Populus trichocarpa]